MVLVLLVLEFVVCVSSSIFHKSITSVFFKISTLGLIPGYKTRIKGLKSVAGLVIQATGRTEFEDALRPGSPGGVLSDNPSVRTSSLVTLVL